MYVLVHPPAQAKPGAVLAPPLVVHLGPIEGHGYGSDFSHRSALLWAFVSLVAEDGRTLLSPPSPDLLAGTLTDSVHALELEDDEASHVVGFLSFANIAIRNPGRYRLKITLVKMDTKLATVSPTAVNLQSIVSDPIDVDEAAHPKIPGDAERELLDALEVRGLRVR